MTGAERPSGVQMERGQETGAKIYTDETGTMTLVLQKCSFEISDEIITYFSADVLNNMHNEGTVIR